MAKLKVYEINAISNEVLKRLKENEKNIDVRLPKKITNTVRYKNYKKLKNNIIKQKKQLKDTEEVFIHIANQIKKDFPEYFEWRSYSSDLEFLYKKYKENKITLEEVKNKVILKSIDNVRIEDIINSIVNEFST